MGHIVSQVSNSHRIAWIDAQIRASRYPNATTVATRFEISRRQAARDIEYLRHSMGAPIEFSPQHNGYRYIDETYALPALMVSDPERSALVYLAERYAAHEGEAADRVARVLRRLGNCAVPAEAPEGEALAIDSVEMDAVTNVRRAISARRIIAVRYRGPDGVPQGRTMWPYAVIGRLGQLSCVAYCEEMGYTHVFPLFRFERVEQTGAEFEIPPHVRPHVFERSSVPPQPFVATIRFADQTDAERIEGVQSLDDGVYRIEFHDARSLISALMACPSAFQVLTPNWLRERVMQKLDALRVLHGQMRPDRR